MPKGADLFELIAGLAPPSVQPRGDWLRPPSPQGLISRFHPLQLASRGSLALLRALPGLDSESLGS